MENEKRIWGYFKNCGLSDAGVAGLIGNLQAESALNPMNLQNTYESKLGYTDESYTKAVDEGDYNKFSTDSAGYGLAQWTYRTRKAGLLALAKIEDKSIGDLDLQLCYLKKEMIKFYNKVWEILKTTSDIYEATIEVMTKYEGPADQSTTAKNKRFEYAKEIFNRNAEIKDQSEKTRETDEDGVELIDTPEYAPEVFNESKVENREELKENVETKEEEIKQEAKETVEEKQEESKNIEIKNNNTYIEFLATEISLGIWGENWEQKVLEKLRQSISRVQTASSYNGQYYKVISGDTLTKIANRFNTSIEKIIEDNILTYPSIAKNYINIGWVLKINL